MKGDASPPRPAEKADPSPAGVSDFPVGEVLDGLAEGFFALDSNWRFVAFNRAAEEIFSLRRKDVIGRLLWEVSPAVVGTEFEQRYRLVMETREKQEFEAHPTRLPDAWHEVRAFPLGDGVGVAFRDVTERRKMLETLRRREVELAHVQEIGGVGGMWIDLSEGFVGHRSPEYLNLYGLPTEAAIESHEAWLGRIHPDDRAEANKRFLDAISGVSRDYASEYRIIRPNDGSVRWIRAVGQFQRNAEGRALALIGAHIDVTERRLAEQEARDNEDRLRSIADALPVLISYLDRDEVFRFVNRAYEVWFERPRSEILGHKVTEVMTPAMYAARRPYLERALKGEEVSYEAEFPRSKGAMMTEVVHVPHLGPAGEVFGVYVIVTDITQRKLAERTLAESEARFRTIANSAPVLIWVTGADGAREFVNEAYTSLLGLPYEEALRFDWRDAMHPDDLPRIRATEPVVTPDLKTVTVEARFRRADGAWRWLRSVSQPRWSLEGRHIGFIGVAYDITDAKQAQADLTLINETLERRVEQRTAELAASEALVKSFFEHSSECHVILVEDRGNFRFQAANPATLRLYGMSRDQVIGRTTLEVLGPEGSRIVDAQLREGLRKGVSRYERTVGEKPVEAVVTAVPDREGEVRRVVVTARDVSERKRLEEQLWQSQKMEALGQLIGGVAHDFNNLLTLMLGGLDTIDRQLAQLPDSPPKARIERSKDMAMQGVQRARALTGRLLAFSRRQTLAPRTVDANALVEGLCDLLQRTLGEPIALRTLLADGLWHTFVDPNQLESVLINLALNARDAMPRGGKLIVETANRRLKAAELAALPERIEPGDYVMIAVSDTGLGMDDETRKRAFDPFFTTKEIGKGTGLGLSQVYGFSRQSGGFAQIESEPGRGATVRIHLPRQTGFAANTNEQERQEADQAGGGRETVLVVEDDDAVRAYATETLRDLGYKVAEASNGEMALDLVKKARRLDLLLTDVVMPGALNGRELAEEAVRRRPGLKVLFMTGYSRDVMLRQGRVGPGMPVISKPFSLEELAAKVRSRLDAIG